MNRSTGMARTCGQTLCHDRQDGAWVRRLTPGTTHTFVVRARDGSGNASALSGAVTATTQPSSDTVAPTTPVLLRANDGGVGAWPEELWLGWTASTDDAVTGPEYEVRVNGVIIEVVGGTGTVAYTEVARLNSVTIIAVDRAGNASAPSNAIPVTTRFVSCG